ncbi:FAD-dependent oxidoreductase [Mycoplasma marinum]|uniref:FAD-dependent oxidoreductase n=1 Tax=Mycoplasma marinum TaxID=1937190 RepID=UPI003B2FE385
MKIVVLGANHAGTSFIRTLAAKTQEHEIIAYDKNSNISFLGCGIALWVSDEFKDPKGLFYSSPEELTSMGVTVKMEHEIIEVNTEKKQVKVKNLKTGEEFYDTYDKLVYSGGTWPIVPPFKGINLNNIYISKLFQHAQKIKELAKDKNIKNVVVIGAGYIGIELVEAFNKAGKNVTLVDMQGRVISRYFDEEFTSKMEERMTKDGIKIQMNEKVKEFIGDGKGNVAKVVTDKGEYDADMVILSIGFRAQTKMLENQIDLDEKNKTVLVNEFMQTSDKDVYALGDSVSLMHNSLDRPMHVALATNAVKTGLVAAHHVLGTNLPFPGVQGTNGINVFGCVFASTGISAETAKAMNVDFKETYWEDKDRPEWMHNAEDVQIKIVFDPKSLRILGAQIGSFGNANHTEAIFMLSLAISKKMTLLDIALMDFYFLPHYNKPFNYILQSVLNGLEK